MSVVNLKDAYVLGWLCLSLPPPLILQLGYHRDTSSTTFALQTTRFLLQDPQVSAAAPCLSTTCWHALRNLRAQFFATCWAFVVRRTILTLKVYAAFPSGCLFFLKSARSMLRSFLRNQLQNISTGFKSGDFGGQLHSSTFLRR